MIHYAQDTKILTAETALVKHDVCTLCRNFAFEGTHAPTSPKCPAYAIMQTRSFLKGANNGLLKDQEEALIAQQTAEE